jgi:Spy/CpxP family protein refolding chaperone
MHPGMMGWWRRRHGCGEAEQSDQYAGPGAHGWHGGSGFHMGFRGGGGDDFGGGSFGVRRPLRFLAFKLSLSEQQVGDLAKILDELKTERAQAAVDDRRTTAAFADAVGGDAFDETKAAEGGGLRVKGAERLRDAVLKALGKIHALLDAEQRKHLAYLVRTGALSI